jgi:molecular chaperone GrpE
MADDRADQNAEAAADAPLPEANNLLEQLRADIEAARERLLRSQAELDNYRKRAAREIEENRRYANLPLMYDLLPVLDNLERAIAAAQTHDVAGLLEGVKLVDKQFEDALARHHCLRIPTLHQPFDPHLHHAISQQPSDEFPPGTVILVSQCGFQLHDRVVRPSQVIVSTAKEKEASD